MGYFYLLLDLACWSKCHTTRTGGKQKAHTRRSRKPNLEWRREKNVGVGCIVRNNNVCVRCVRASHSPGMRTCVRRSCLLTDPNFIGLPSSIQMYERAYSTHVCGGDEEERMGGRVSYWRRSEHQGMLRLRGRKMGTAVHSEEDRSKWIGSKLAQKRKNAPEQLIQVPQDAVLSTYNTRRWVRGNIFTT